MKNCTKCNEPRDEALFGKCGNRPDGLSAWCRWCRKTADAAYYQANADRRRAKSAAYRAAHPEKIRAQRVARYGLTHDQYDQMLKEQCGRCKICRAQPGENQVLCVDHRHDTGTVRGLLCHRCNKAIGLLQDDAERIRAAAEYVSNG